MPLGLVGHDLAREGIDFLRDPQLRRTAIDVGPAMRPALILGETEDRRVPPFGAREAVRVQRQPDPVADPRILGVVHGADDGPFT